MTISYLFSEKTQDMRVKIIIASVICLFCFSTTLVSAGEVTTLCRFINPETDRPEVGAVLGNDKILPLQSVYSKKNNGEISPYLRSIKDFFSGDGETGKSLMKELVAEAKKMEVPGINPEDVTLLPPVESVKLTAGSVFEGHARGARESWARELVPVKWAIATLIGGGPFDPPQEHYEKVTYYQGNHLDWYPHKSSIILPKTWESIDFEIEIAMLVVKSFDKYKIGGYFLFNDVTHRKTQGVELDKVKHGFSLSKHINSTGWKFVLAEHVDFSMLASSATIKRSNGEIEKLCQGNTNDALFTPEKILESITNQEGKLHVGQVITTGSMTGCCGLEILGAADADLIYPGDTILFESEILGNLENTVIK